MKKENNNGITLIALVITIIIMIILVAVSVTLAIKGDLFGNAQEGTDRTRIAAEKEQLTEYVFGQYKRQDNTGEVELNLNIVRDIVNEDKERFKGADFEGNLLKVTGKSEIVYYVDENGTITENSSKKQDEKWYRISYENLTKENLDSLDIDRDFTGPYLVPFVDSDGNYGAIAVGPITKGYDVVYTTEPAFTFEEQEYQYNLENNQWNKQLNLNKVKILTLDEWLNGTITGPMGDYSREGAIELIKNSCYILPNYETVLTFTEVTE